MDQRMNEAIKVAVQIQSDRLHDKAQAENEEFLKNLDENIQKIINEQVKEQVKVQVSKILSKIEKTVNEQLEAEVLTRSSDSSKTSYTVAADLSEMELKKILIEKMEGDKDIFTLKRRRDDDADKDKEPSAGSDRGPIDEEKEKSQSQLALQRRKRPGQLASAADDQTIAEASQHPKWFQQQKKPPTPNPFLMNRLKVDTLTPELLAGPTYELMKGSCKSLFYGFAVNKEFAQDVYSKRRIITVTNLQIVKWHNYKHLDWITVCRDGDKLYKFKEERFAFNVSLRMFTRSIVIQRRLEDLQLGVESYQKKLNLTRSDTYHSDLKRKEAYTTYSNPRGFVYQNKDKQNRLMRIDELHNLEMGRSMMFTLLWMIILRVFG
nr:hypothetical protein [Tanacetum cinerariifolium]